MSLESGTKSEPIEKESKEVTAAENIEAALEQYVSELASEDVTPDLSPEQEKTILRKIRENPKFSKTLRAFLLGISTLASSPALAETKPTPQIEQAAKAIDAEKSAMTPETKALAKKCHDECGAGVLENKAAEWVQEAHIDPKSMKWEAHSRYGGLGYTVDVTVMDDRIMMERRGLGIKSEVTGLLRSETKWQVERIKDMDANFTGEIQQPSPALKELVLQSAKKSGLSGTVSVEVQTGHGSLGGYVMLNIKDGTDHSFQERAPMRQNENADSAATKHLANKLGLVSPIKTASR